MCRRVRAQRLHLLATLVLLSAKVRALGRIIGLGATRRLALGDGALLRRVLAGRRTGSTLLGRVGRCRRHDFHRGVSLCCRGGFLRRVQIRLSASRREVMLVMGAHWVLHARVGVVGVLHGNVVVTVAADRLLLLLLRAGVDDGRPGVALLLVLIVLESSGWLLVLLLGLRLGGELGRLGLRGGVVVPR